MEKIFFVCFSHSHNILLTVGMTNQIVHNRLINYEQISKFTRESHECTEDAEGGISLMEAEINEAGNWAALCRLRVRQTHPRSHYLFITVLTGLFAQLPARKRTSNKNLYSLTSYMTKCFFVSKSNDIFCKNHNVNNRYTKNCIELRRTRLQNNGVIYRMLREMRASLKPIYKTEFGLITANEAAGIYTLHRFIKVQVIQVSNANTALFISKCFTGRYRLNN